MFRDEHAHSQRPVRSPRLRDGRWYELKDTLRTPAFVLPTLVFPVSFYLLFALAIPGHWQAFHKATYLFATFSVFGVVGPALFAFGVHRYCIPVARPPALGPVAPLPTSVYLVAKLCTTLVFAAIVIALLSVAAFGLGGVRMSVSSYLLLSALLLAGTLPFCAIGWLIGTLVKGPASVVAVNLVALPMAVLSGLWMPLFALPAVVQKAAVVWPAWHLAQLALATVGEQAQVDPGQHVVALFGTTAIFSSLAAWRLRRAQ